MDNSNLLALRLLMIGVCAVGLGITAWLVRLGHPIQYAAIPASVLVHMLVLNAAAVWSINLWPPVDPLALEQVRHIFAAWGNAAALHAVLEIATGLAVMVYLHKRRRPC